MGRRSEIPYYDEGFMGRRQDKVCSTFSFVARIYKFGLQLKKWFENYFGRRLPNYLIHRKVKFTNCFQTRFVAEYRRTRRCTKSAMRPKPAATSPQTPKTLKLLFRRLHHSKEKLIKVYIENRRKICRRFYWKHKQE